jgi:SAM-dependent methyltransferase
MRHHLEFSGNIPNDQLKTEAEYSKLNAYAYEPYGNYLFYRLIKKVPNLSLDMPDYFIDIGCGKGKQCIYANKYFHFKKIIGIDFSPELIAIARKNSEKLGLNNFQFIHADASNWIIGNKKSIIFLYNPFNEIILEKFLKNNMTNFIRNKSYICYANDVHRSILLKLKFDLIYRDNYSSIYQMQSN